MNTPSDDLRGYRQVLGSFGTGVVVVTALERGVPVGITVNSFTSVSLQPPLVLWSIANRSTMREAFCTAGHFAIHVLHAQQRDVCERFAQSGGSPFVGIRWAQDGEGVPRLTEFLARFQCRRFALHPAGDHSIVVGEVLGFESSNGAPLLFVRGQYLDAAALVTD